VLHCTCPPFLEYHFAQINNLLSSFRLKNIIKDTILHGVTVSELLFSGGLARCFWGSTNQSSANRAPSALRTTHRSNPGTAHPLAAYATVTLRHSVPSFSTSKTPPFSGGHQEARRSEKRHPLGPLEPEDVFKGCPRPLLTPSRLLNTHYPLTCPPTLSSSPSHILIF
jgi:hypothetical protein